jgi:hypothetical protein
MCLEISELNTKHLSKLFDDFGQMTMYKIVDVRKGTPKGLYYSEYVYNPGVNVSDRESISLTEDERNRQIIRKGIHVFTTRWAASQGQECRAKWEKIIPVIVKKEDFIGAGERDAVFMKIDIDEADLEHAITQWMGWERLFKAITQWMGWERLFKARARTK